MKLHLPDYSRRRLQKAKVDNRRLRSENAQLQHDHAIAVVRAVNAADRADALEKVNDELRADLSSWMDKAVSSDG